MKKLGKKNWLKITLCVLVACAIVGGIISVFQFRADAGRTSANSSLEFSFDGAADGIAPNGYAFTIDAIESDEVLSSALESAGMADRYTVDQIREQLETTGVYPENIVEQMMSYESLLDFSANRTLTISAYHPTLYSVSLYNDFDTKISSADLQKLLGCILESYKSYFAATYSAGTNDVGISYNLTDYDYPQRLTILTRLMQESATYAEEMYEQNPSLTLNGQGFNDIAVRLNNLISTDIDKLSANVTINALTQNPGRLLTQYQYEIRSLNNQLARKKDQLSRMEELLAAYDKNEIIYLSTTDSLTKIDGNSSETYDKLVAARKDVADEITGINTEITTYQLRLNDLMKEDDSSAQSTATAAEPAEPTGSEEAGDGEGETEETAPAMSQEEIDAMAAAAEEAAKKQTAALEASINELVAKREAVMTDFAGLIKLYNDTHINDLTVSTGKVRYYTPKLLSGAFIKKAIMTAGPICAVGFIVCLLVMIISRRKEEKAAK